MCDHFAYRRRRAHANAPQQKTQAPGYYRMMLGDVEVTALSDGIFPMKVSELLTNITPKQLDDGLQRKKVFADAAAHGDWVAGAHLSFPGIGHLRAADSGYVFVPANYSVPH